MYCAPINKKKKTAPKSIGTIISNSYCGTRTASFSLVVIPTMWLKFAVNKELIKKRLSFWVHSHTMQPSTEFHIHKVCK